jgi:hypothetical protein
LIAFGTFIIRNLGKSHFEKEICLLNCFIFPRLIYTNYIECFRWLMIHGINNIIILFIFLFLFIFYCWLFSKIINYGNVATTIFAGTVCFLVDFLEISKVGITGGIAVVSDAVADALCNLHAR